ncbi:Chromosome partition protein Smc [Aquimixticola soesokkakensis]|uniref:Chromosome partition protein Smc n=1 Tax=Aquimixticola soesokkakensis TaxID=1519096 RepID=A0A1Y5T5H4_9RHOB|nr:hypothetical protein [Aquimixticola soesokkakensis]SLN56246.1 Chromosome partition protein Smc [Aquimixticola soesokkakensis]
MKLLSLQLTNVRKFAGKTATISGIGDGITVVSQANEFGKSTFFDGIYALFFEKYGSSAKPVKSLQPYGGGAVEVAADIATQTGRFRVEKRFLSRKSARIIRLSDMAVVAQDDEAERWISQMLGAGKAQSGGGGEGPAGLLWVRQGVLGLEAETPKDRAAMTETRRDLLSSVAGEIDTMTGGRRMDRVMRRVAEELGVLHTKTGRPTGAFKAALDLATTLETDHAALESQVTDLEEALGARKAARATLQRLADPQATALRAQALEAARRDLEVAQAHAGKVAQAAQALKLAQLAATGADQSLQGFLLAQTTLDEAQKAQEAASGQARAADRQVRDHKARHAEAAAVLEAARTRLAQARQRLDVAHGQADARAAQGEARQLGDQITKAQAQISLRDTALARVNACGATAAWLSQVEAQAREVTQLAGQVAAQTTTLRLSYAGQDGGGDGRGDGAGDSGRVLLDGQVLAADRDVTVSGTQVLTLEGIGALEVHAPAPSGDAPERLRQVQADLEALLAQVGVQTIVEARARATARQEDAAAVELARAVLVTLAPEGLEALQAAKAAVDLRATAARAPRASQTDSPQDTDSPQETDIPDESIDALRATVTRLEGEEASARRDASGAQADHSQARETAISAEATLQVAQDSLARAQGQAGPPEDVADRRAALLQAQAEAAEELRVAQAADADLRASAPDLATAEAEFARCEQVVAEAARQSRDLGEQHAALTAMIQTLAGGGIEERRDEVAGQLEAARADVARFAAQAGALTRLRDALEAERQAARETYFGPVQEELKPLLAILHREASLQFDSDSLLPAGLRRGATEEGLEDLSGGTREQIAILTRLAFARLFARQGLHMPIVLDDALVFSDDARIVKMFTALTRVAQNQQILVFSCRQMAFENLGGTRPQVTVEQA